MHKDSSLLRPTPALTPLKPPQEFGYSRKDVLIISAALTALGYALYYGLQAGGMEPGMAGNWVQLAISVGLCIGWVSTYLFRVATKVRWVRGGGCGCRGGGGVLGGLASMLVAV